MALSAILESRQAYVKHQERQPLQPGAPAAAGQACRSAPEREQIARLG
jgi:hypothetical protein